MRLRYTCVSIPRRDFWVFQPEVSASWISVSGFQSLEGIFGFFNSGSTKGRAKRLCFNP
ncbi:hypothetical protein CKA32_000697 [Geitlerinema sp. FC II]|nr:hypothetical protein CKA32_000697 [Geitlerinema sp. FC II]